MNTHREKQNTETRRLVVERLEHRALLAISHGFGSLAIEHSLAERISFEASANESAKREARFDSGSSREGNGKNSKRTDDGKNRQEERDKQDGRSTRSNQSKRSQNLAERIEKVDSKAKQRNSDRRATLAELANANSSVSNPQTEAVDSVLLGSTPLQLANATRPQSGLADSILSAGLLGDASSGLVSRDPQQTSNSTIAQQPQTRLTAAVREIADVFSAARSVQTQQQAQAEPPISRPQATSSNQPTDSGRAAERSQNVEETENGAARNTPTNDQSSRTSIPRSTSNQQTPPLPEVRPERSAAVADLGAAQAVTATNSDEAVQASQANATTSTNVSSADASAVDTTANTSSLTTWEGTSLHETISQVSFTSELDGTQSPHALNVPTFEDRATNEDIVAELFMLELLEPEVEETNESAEQEHTAETDERSVDSNETSDLANNEQDDEASNEATETGNQVLDTVLAVWEENLRGDGFIELGDEAGSFELDPIRARGPMTREALGRIALQSDARVGELQAFEFMHAQKATDFVKAHSQTPQISELTDEEAETEIELSEMAAAPSRPLVAWLLPLLAGLIVQYRWGMNNEKREAQAVNQSVSEPGPAPQG